jgi:DNA polymerase-1
MRLAIDANNWCHKDFSAGGLGAVESNFLGRLSLIEHKFTDILVAFDSDRSFRHDIFEGYKSGREEKPELDQAMEGLRLKLQDKYVVGRVAGLEADDLIASYVGLSVADECKVVIASSDKDMHQLLKDGMVTQMTSIRKKLGGGFDCQFITEKTLLEKYGLRADQWVEYRMLTGDASDKIPGCKGIGPKTASEVLCKCGTLEKFWEDPESWGFTKSVTAKLVEFKEQADLFRRLIDLRLDSGCIVP